MTPEETVIAGVDEIGQDEYSAPSPNMGDEIDILLDDNGFSQMPPGLTSLLNDWQLHYTPSSWSDLIKWIWRKIKELAQAIWDYFFGDD